MRGAMFPYRVLNTGVPGGARARVDKSLKFTTAGKLGPLLVFGEKSISQRKPYVRVRRGHPPCILSKQSKVLKD